MHFHFTGKIEKERERVCVIENLSADLFPKGFNSQAKAKKTDNQKNRDAST